MTESFFLLFSFRWAFPNSMVRPDVRTHRSHRGRIDSALCGALLRPPSKPLSSSSGDGYCVEMLLCLCAGTMTFI
jgi:hypothetical protein